MTPLFVNGLGEREYGVWALVESVLAYLALFDLGIGAAVVRYGAKFEVTQRTDDFNRMFNTSFAMFSSLGLLAMAIALGVAFVPQSPLGVPGDMAYLTRWLILLLGLNLATTLSLGVYDALLCAVGRFPLRTGVQVSVLALRTITFLVILANGGGLLSIGLAITVFGILQNLILAILAHYLVSGLRISHRFVSLTTFHAIRGYSLWAFLIMLASRLSFSTDAIVISTYLSPEYITYFAIGARLTEYSKSAIQAAATVLTPTVSAHHSIGEMEAIRHILLVGSRAAVWFILPLQFGLLVLGRQFISLWISQDIAEDSYAPLVALALPLVLTASQYVSGRIFYGIGDLKWYTVATLCEAGANLILSIILIRTMGIVGVAIGTAIPNIAFNLAVMRRVCRLTEVHPWYYLSVVFARPLLAGCCAVVVWFLADQTFSDAPLAWWRLLLVGVSGAACYLIVLLALEAELRGALGRVIARIAPA